MVELSHLSPAGCPMGPFCAVNVGMSAGGIPTGTWCTGVWVRKSPPRRRPRPS